MVFTARRYASAAYSPVGVRLASRLSVCLPTALCRNGGKTYKTRYRPGGGETIRPRRWRYDPKIAADVRPSADGSAFRTSLVAGGG